MHFKYSITSNKRTKKKDNWQWEIHFPSGAKYGSGESFKPKEDVIKDLIKTCKRLDVQFGYANPGMSLLH